MNIRHFIFTIKELLTGGSIIKQVKDIRKIMESPLNAEFIAKERLLEIMNHAQHTTKFYENNYSKELKDFHVLNKETLKKYYEDFFSKEYNRADLITTNTSGSYGTPLTYYFTKNKKDRQKAEVIYFGKLSNYEVGDRHAFIRIKDKSKFVLFLQNEILINPTRIDEDFLDEMRKKLKKGIKVIIGYPSTIYLIARYCMSKGDTKEDFSLKSIITIAEPLSYHDKSMMESFFGCPVLGRYSTEEFGVLANQCIKGNYHLNVASFEFEFLKLDTDQEASQGESSRIIVTDFYSHAMPLIRYDTGDIGTYVDGCSCGYKGRVLTEIEGRVVESIFTPEGTRITPFAISSSMRNFDGILQYQFVQENKDQYLLKIVPDNNGQIDEIRIRDYFYKLLTKNAELNIEYLASIPPLKSGKRPYIINEYKRKK